MGKIFLPPPPIILLLAIIYRERGIQGGPGGKPHQDMAEFDANLDLDQLDVNGFSALPLDGAVQAQAGDAEAQFMRGARAWYEHHLQQTLGLGHLSSEAWRDALSRPPLCTLTFTDEKGLSNLMSATYRKKNMTPEHNKAVRAAIDGGGNAQFHPYKGLRNSGFGWPNHLRLLQVGIQSAEACADKLEHIMGRPVTIDGAVHMLYKVPDNPAADLNAHVDGGVSPRTIWERAGEASSLREFIRAHGAQTLAHIAGGGAEDGGQTLALQYLTPQRLFVLFTMLHPDFPHPAASYFPSTFDFDSAPPGPIFGPFFDVKAGLPGSLKRKRPEGDSEGDFLSNVNAVLAILEGCALSTQDCTHSQWLQKIETEETAVYTTMLRCKSPTSLPPLKVAPICPPTDVGPYMAVWPLGFPHGSRRTLARGRLTVNVHVTASPAADGSKKRDLAIDRVLALLRGEDVPPAPPFEGGIVHRMPIMEEDNFPFFEELYPSQAELESFKERCRARDRRVAECADTFDNTKAPG